DVGRVPRDQIPYDLIDGPVPLLFEGLLHPVQDLLGARLPFQIRNGKEPRLLMGRPHAVSSSFSKPVPPAGEARPAANETRTFVIGCGSHEHDKTRTGGLCRREADYGEIPR